MVLGCHRLEGVVSVAYSLVGGSENDCLARALAWELKDSTLAFAVAGSLDSDENLDLAEMIHFQFEANSSCRIQNHFPS